MPHVDAGSVRFLSSPAGADALAAAREARALPLHRRAAAVAAAVGDACDDAEIRTALQQDDVRRRAIERCPHAEELLFTREALEQATAWDVAAERATRWPGDASVTDLGAGIGLDALAIATTGRAVIAYEQDPVRAAMLRFNAAALDVAARVTVHEDDVLAAAPTGENTFFDPDRRPGGDRTRDPDAFEPPAEVWGTLLGRFARAIVKLPPVVEGALPLDGPEEVVALGGRARERRLFVGDWPGVPARRALALPSGRSVEGAGVSPPAPVAVEDGAWILDPDVSVTLAGLVGDLAARDGLAPLADGVAYLVGEEPNEVAPGHWVRVDATLKAKPKVLNRWLREHDVGDLTIRKRGIDAKAADWRKRLRADGTKPATLVFTRDRDDRWVVYASLM